MHFINPFKGLRPTEEKVSSVSIPSTDHLSEEVVAKHKKNNPWSYLNIFTNKASIKIFLFIPFIFLWLSFLIISA